MLTDLDLFKELRKTYFEALRGETPTYREFNFIGSRGSGKTHQSMDECIKFFFMDKNNIIYIFRENQSDLENFKSELFPKLEDLGFRVKSGINGNYNARLNQVSNGYNKIIFKALNAEKMDVSKGKGAGLPVWKDADNIIAFFEECTQMDEELVNITIQGLRGHKKTNIIKIFCANPWSPLNWYVQKCNNLLKENLNELLEFGYQKYVGLDHKGQEVVVIRNNIYTNPYLQEDLVREYESYKEKAYNMWLVCCVGMSAALGEMIYATNLPKMKPVNYDILLQDTEGFYQGGVDWGDGSSIGASPTACHFGKINIVLGVDIIDELTIWNNKDSEKLTTTDQIDRVIEFYKACLLKYRKPFKVYLDNASLSDFYQMFNARLELHGLDTRYIEFLPTIKTPIEMRIDVINVMIASGLYRVDKDACPDLYNALATSRWVDKKQKEGGKRERNHAETHWINSGAEYILYNSIYDFKTRFNTIFEKVKY